MKSVLVVASSLLLAACAGNQQLINGGPPVTNVTVNGTYIVINQEPIVTRGPATVTWNVIANGYEFPDTPMGIEFKNPGPPYSNPTGVFSCAPKGVIISCKNTGAKGMYRYTIRVKRASD